MGKFIEIEDTFGDIWKELESVKERLYLIDLVDSDTMINNISNTVQNIQTKVLDLQHKYEHYFAGEIDKEMEEEA